jgi:2-phosphoglycerate kinase
MMGLSSIIGCYTGAKEHCAIMDIEEKSDDEIIKEYVKVCRNVRKGCNFDIQKCFVDGKPLIIEGSHIEPNLYIKQCETEEGTVKLEINTPEPADEEEDLSENESIKKMRKQMQSIN